PARHRRAPHRRHPRGLRRHPAGRVSSLLLRRRLWDVLGLHLGGSMARSLLSLLAVTCIAGTAAAKGAPAAKAEAEAEAPAAAPRRAPRAARGPPAARAEAEAEAPAAAPSDWTVGPGVGRMRNSQIPLPAGMRFTGEKGAQAIMEQLQNPITGREYGLVMKDA